MQLSTLWHESFIRLGKGPIEATQAQGTLRACLFRNMQSVDVCGQTAACNPTPNGAFPCGPMNQASVAPAYVWSSLLDVWSLDWVKRCIRLQPCSGEEGEGWRGAG